MAPEFKFGCHDNVTIARLTSVTSGFEGALGIKFGSVGLAGCTGTPNSFQAETTGERNTKICYDFYLYFNWYFVFGQCQFRKLPGCNYRLNLSHCIADVNHAEHPSLIYLELQGRLSM